MNTKGLSCLCVYVREGEEGSGVSEKRGGGFPCATRAVAANPISHPD